MPRRAFSNAKPGNGIVLSSANGGLTGVLRSWQYSDTITGADPGSGFMRFNHADPESGAFIYVSDTDGQDAAMGGLLDELVVGTKLQIKSANAPAQFIIVTITSNSDNSAAGWHTLGYSVVEGTPNFLDSETLAVEVGFVGAQGPAGTGDVTGPASATDGYAILFDGVTGKLIKSAGYTPREVLTANRTYYVDGSSGSDGNDGLATGAGAFATIQKAVDVVYGTLDLGGYTVTVSVADGTYTAGFTCNGPVPNGNLKFTGNVSTPANCHISITSGQCITASNYAAISLAGFKLSASSGIGLYANTYATIVLHGTMDFGACNTQAYCTTNATMNLLQNYTISGSAINHYSISTFGTVNCYNRTITLTGTPAFSGYFARVEFFSFLYSFSNTYTGLATGTRYIAKGNAIIQTGGGATYLPGDVNGSVNTQGQYL